MPHRAQAGQKSLQGAGRTQIPAPEARLHAFQHNEDVPDDPCPQGCCTQFVINVPVQGQQIPQGRHPGGKQGAGSLGLEKDASGEPGLQVQPGWAFFTASADSPAKRSILS